MSVNVLVPPQLLGGLPVNPLKFIEPLQPPEKLLVLTQFCIAMLSWARVWQTGLIRGVGQASEGAGAFGTVKVAWQVLEAWQADVTVKVTVVLPPQKDGAPVLLFVNTPLHPPVNVAVANQVLNAALTAACVWQAVVVVFTGQVSTTGGSTVQVNTCVQVAVFPHPSVAV